MSLTRKHFKDIAEMIGNSSNFEELVSELKSFCKRYNPRFNINKFNDYINKIRIKKDSKFL